MGLLSFLPDQPWASGGWPVKVCNLYIKGLMNERGKAKLFHSYSSAGSKCPASFENLASAAFPAARKSSWLMSALSQVAAAGQNEKAKDMGSSRQPIPLPSFSCVGETLSPHLLISRQAALSRLDRTEAAAFLFDQIILDAADFFSGGEDFQPR